MSQIHILTTGGNVRCRRETIRGFLTPEQYAALAAQNKIHTRVKTRVSHDCDKRPCLCPRRKEAVSAMCQECIR